MIRSAVHRSAPVLTCGLFLFVLFVAACSDLPTRSVPVHPPDGPRTVPLPWSPPEALGSASVQIPESSTDNDPAGLMIHTGINVPPESWVHFKLEGGVLYTGNRGCDALPPYWSCSYPLDGETFGPWLRSGALGAGILVAGSTDGSIERPAPGQWYPAGGEQANAMVKEALMYTHSGGEVFVARGMIYEGAWNPNYNLNVPSYFYSGHQSVTVEKVVPLKVTASGSIGAGNRLTATVEPAPGMALVTGDFGTRSGVWWTFEELDDHGNHIGGSVLGQCENATTCSYEALRPGYFTASAYVQAQLVDARSEVVGIGQRCDSSGQAQRGESRANLVLAPVCEVGPARLKLICTPAGADSIVVERGGSLSCTLTVDPVTGVLTRASLTYGDSAGHEIVGPSGDGPQRWSGRMAVSGLLKGSGTVDGERRDTSVLIRVRARKWPHFGITVSEAGNGDLPAPSQVQAPGDLAATVLSEPVPFPIESITTGPNTGWSYMGSLSQLPVKVYISDAWKPGSAWYNLQSGGPHIDPVTGRRTQVGYCTAQDIPVMLQAAREHEGSMSGQGTSHVDVLRRFFEQNDPQEQMEAYLVFAPDLSGLTVLQSFLAEYGELARTPATTDPHQRHTNDDPLNGQVDPAVFPCYARPWH